MFTIDEDLWFGCASDPGDGAAKRSLSASVARELGVRAAPTTAAALAALDLDAAPIDRVIEIFESDPALAARVLSVVNSSGYALSYRCRSIRHAVVMLGAPAVASIATAASLSSVFVHGHEAAEALAARAHDVALLAAHLAFLAGESREQAYATGLLCDLGRAMLLQSEPDRYGAICREEDDSSIVPRERETFGFDHASLAGCVLRAWRIPAPIPRVIACHHAPQPLYAAGGREAALVCILRLADRLAPALRASPTPDPETMLAIAAEPSADLLDLETQSLSASWTALRAVLMEPASPEANARRHSLLPSPASIALQAPPSIALLPANDAHAPMRCVRCTQPTLGDECPACRRPLCRDHLPAGNVCEACEYAAAAARASDPSLRAILGATALAGAGWLALLVALAVRRVGGHAAPELDVSFVVTSLVMALFAAGAALRAYQVRMAALSERAGAAEAEARRASLVPDALHTTDATDAQTEELAWSAEQHALRAATLGDVLGRKIEEARSTPPPPAVAERPSRPADATTVRAIPVATIQVTPYSFLESLRAEIARPEPTTSPAPPPASTKRRRASTPRADHTARAADGDEPTPKPKRAATRRARGAKDAETVTKEPTAPRVRPRARKAIAEA
jgi:HD-like signal output (HDOD) protein